MSNHFYHKRQFLNDKEGVAMLEVYVDDECRDHNGKRSFCVEGAVRITDCSRGIELDISAYENIEDVRDRVRKLDRLIDALQGARDALARIVKREFGRKV